MAYSMWVLLDRARLPSVEQFVDVVEASEFPLRIDKDWDWASHSGWLPMMWGDEETGFEVDTEVLESADIDAAASAGHAGLDAVVVLTTRGWDSLKVANAFAACLVESCGGVISEDEDEYLSGEEALNWARKSIDDAVRGEREEAEREAAREKALSEGDPESVLTSALAEMAGRPVSRFNLVNDLLGTHIEGGFGVSGTCWRLHHGGRTYDVTRFRMLKEKQHNLIDTVDNWQEVMEAMEPELDDADKLDAADIESAYAILKGLAEHATVSEVRWRAPETIEVKLAGDGGTVVEYLNAGYLPSMSVRTSELQFSISKEIRIF